MPDAVPGDDNVLGATRFWKNAYIPCCVLLLAAIIAVPVSGPKQVQTHKNKIDVLANNLK